MTQVDDTDDLRESLQVQSPDEVVDWLNVLIYGDPGAGKTWLAGTAEDHPDTNPVLVLDVEGGVTTIRHRKVDVIPVRSMPQVEKIYNKLYHSIENGRIYYRTVVLDSLTELADLDMRFIMKEAYERNPEKVDIDVPSQREWGKNRSHIRRIVRAFRDLPCHVIMTASVATLQEEGQPTRYFPGFAGKLRTEVPGFMDIVGYLYSENKTGVINRKLQVVGTRRVQAKDRTSTLGGSLENTTISEIWNHIISGTLNPSAVLSESSETLPEESIEATAA
jgi:phage nucleotide-binding protein